MPEIIKTTHVEWSKHPELLIRIGQLREEGFTYAEIRDVLWKQHQLNVHSSVVKSAYKRHQEFILLKLREEELPKMKKRVRHAAKTRITAQVLEDLLDIPAGVYITCVSFDATRNIVEIIFNDETKSILPAVPEGGSLTEMTPFYVEDNGKIQFKI